MASTLTRSSVPRALLKSVQSLLGTGLWRHHLSNAAKRRLMEVGVREEFQHVREALYSVKLLALVGLVVMFRRPAAGQVQCSKQFNLVGTLSTDSPYYSGSGINQHFLFCSLSFYLTVSVCNLLRLYKPRIDVIFQGKCKIFIRWSYFADSITTFQMKSLAYILPSFLL